MGRNRFVTPEVVRLPISDGDWIEIKKRLNAGEARALENAGLKPPIKVDGKIIQPIDWAIYDLVRAQIFLVNWSLCGPDGTTMGLKDRDGNVDINVLKGLDVPTFDEITKVIFLYVTKQEADAKNGQGATPTSSDSPGTDSVATS